MFDLRLFSVRESRHRIHNPLTERQLADLGTALDLAAGTRLLDLACGSGELLSTWARDHQVTGLGVDLNPDFLAHARARAAELGVSDAVRFVEADASGYVVDEPVDVAACVGATWIGGGVPGTLDLLSQSLKPGGMLLVGEPYWRTVPTTPEVLDGCGVQSSEDYLTLPDLLVSFGAQGAHNRASTSSAAVFEGQAARRPDPIGAARRSLCPPDPPFRACRHRDDRASVADER